MFIMPQDGIPMAIGTCGAETNYAFDKAITFKLTHHVTER